MTSGSALILVRRPSVGQGRFGISAVDVSSDRNSRRALSGTTLPLGERSVKW